MRKKRNASRGKKEGKKRKRVIGKKLGIELMPRTYSLRGGEGGERRG